MSGKGKSKSSKALHEVAVSDKDDNDTYCFDGIVKGMKKREAIKLFRMLRPDVSASDARSMHKDDLCRELGTVVMSKLSEKACAQTLVSAGGVSRDDLVTIAALLSGKPESEFAKRSKEDLCGFVSGRLGIGQRFKLLRRLMPSRVMKKIQAFVGYVAAGVGDVSIFVSSIPYIEQILDLVPKPILIMMQVLTGLRAAGLKNPKLQGWIYMNMIPMLFHIAGVPVPAWIPSVLALLHPERKVEESAKLMAMSGGYLGVRDGAREVRRVAFERRGKSEADAYEDRITKEGMDAIRREKKLENLESEVGKNWSKRYAGGRRMRFGSAPTDGSASAAVEREVREKLHDPAIERFDVKNRARAYRDKALDKKDISERAKRESIDYTEYITTLARLAGDKPKEIAKAFLPARIANLLG
eukprot:jgi/Mesvir1/14657/Mv05325-RA.1